MPRFNSINNIPAKLFFDVLHEKDFTLLEPFDGETEEEIEDSINGVLFNTIAYYHKYLYEKERM